MDLIPKLQPAAEAILTEFIRHKVAKAGAKGLVLGLSGGVDSAVVLALGAEALGKKNVLAVFMPEHDSPKGDLADVRMLCRHFGTALKVVDITRMLETFKGEVDIKMHSSKVAIGNLKARTRMLALYWIANSGNYLVAGTGNKTEMLVGYFTKFGDGASDIAPLGDLYKTQVWELAKALGVPKKIVSKVPTAGLYPGQTDEDELGVKYPVLDQILFGLDMGLSHQDIIGSLQPHGSGDLRTIARIDRLIRSSSHKRILTKIPKMGARTIGIDRRECVD